MRLKKEPFEKIKNGRKKIEMRLYDEKRRQISIKDYIIFESFENKEKLKVRVINIMSFSNFDELYLYYNKKELGYLKEQVASADDMNQYYSYEEIKRYGVVALELEVI